jgi:cobalt-precorrin 5A hydrolase/precorrin-3B C17-methyltransferase
MANAELHAAARQLKLPLRFIHSASQLPVECHRGDGLRLLLGEQPLQIERLGQRRGRLSVVGLGPGAAEHMTPAVRRALD